MTRKELQEFWSVTLRSEDTGREIASVLKEFDPEATK